MNINYKEISYLTFGNCLEISTDEIELIVTLDIGPRVISYKRHNGKNVFYQDPDKTFFVSNEETDSYFYKGAKWYGYGGHRLWRAPESYTTYYPDNEKVDYEVKDNTFRFLSKKQIYNEVEMEIILTIKESNLVEFEGVIHNKSNIDKQFSSWSLSMVKGPGLEIVKLPIDETGFTPQRIYTFWGFGAKSNDPRAFYGSDYFALKMEPGNTEPIKVGMRVIDNKIIYLSETNVFVKGFNRIDNEIYPDNNVNYETYTKDLFLELETLSPLKNVAPNQSISQKETWKLIELTDKIPNDFNEEVLDKLYKKYTK